MAAITRNAIRSNGEGEGIPVLPLAAASSAALPPKDLFWLKGPSSEIWTSFEKLPFRPGTAAPELHLVEVIGVKCPRTYVTPGTRQGGFLLLYPL